MVFKSTKVTREEGEDAWKHLQHLFPQKLLHAPRIDWTQVEPVFLRYLYRSVRKEPWFLHLAFNIGILVCYARLDHQTVRSCMYGLHARWRVLFPHYQITSVEEWKSDEHFPRYLNDSQLPDTFAMRQEFLRRYWSISQHIARYLRSLPEADAELYQQWALPTLPSDLYHALSQSANLRVEQQIRRKEHTDALVPHFVRIRGEAHLRWNQIKRLRDSFLNAARLAQTGQEAFPVTFSYEELHLGLRLSFRVWDRPSFVEHHAEQYAASTKSECRRRVWGFAPEKNHLFLEFLYTEPLRNNLCEVDSLLWFGDLLRLNLLNADDRSCSQEELQKKLDYYESWGYTTEDGTLLHPFRADIAGLLSYKGSEKRFLSEAQKRTQGLIFLVEPLYAAATFGLAALDFFTTTGARNGELIQLSLDPDCLYTLEIEEVQRYMVRLVPKGTDEPANYVVSTETLQNLERVGELLREHYQLQPDESVPSLQFSTGSPNAHRFPKPRPYLFQYNHFHLSENSINACLRFLCHGMIIQTAEGKAVTLKAHALRHVFATHLHQVEQVPLDIIAVMLHQKDVHVTAYYALPTWQQVVTTTNTLLEKFATHLGSAEEAFARAPAELQRQFEEAKAQVGSLNTVPGGQCTCHAICPIAFACTGCVFNVPDPAREDEIVEQEQWAFIRLEQVKRRGLGPEIVKMQTLIQRCHVTRQEMQLMRIYQKDEKYEPTLKIERDEC